MTSRMKKYLLAVELAAGASLVQGEAAAQFNCFIFSGDSLTDAGFYGSRFTVNPGQVWAQDLGAHYGVSVTPVKGEGLQQR